MSASFRMISFLFEVIRGEYLSRTQRLRKGRPSCPFCTRGLYKSDDRYVYIDALAVLLVHVGLAHARPNKGPLLHVPITKYIIIPNPNPNPNTKMTVNTITKQMYYCNIVIAKHTPVHEVLGQ